MHTKGLSSSIVLGFYALSRFHAYYSVETNALIKEFGISSHICIKQNLRIEVKTYE
jgi:hypothetical protein